MAKETWNKPVTAPQSVELDDTDNRQILYWSDEHAPGGVELWSVGECAAFDKPEHVSTADVLTSAERTNLKKYLKKLRAAQAVQAGLSQG